MKRKKEKNAKQRYDDNNPVISIRVTRDERQRLNNLAKFQNMSLSEFVAELAHRRLSNPDEGFEKVYNEGFADGHDLGHEEGYKQGVQKIFEETMNAVQKKEVPIKCQSCGATHKYRISRDKFGLKLK